MVKQFTIPCDFQGQMSPVTLYIGHPEETHHPINFQSQWLSSARGGQVPSDLMDTLQKLHDLAIENNADFEELCYYALISATNNASGNGVSPDDINNYADDFLKKEASGIKPDMPTDNNTPQDGSQPTTQAQNTNENNNVDANGNVITKTQTTSSEATDTAQSTTATDNNTNNNDEQYNTNNQVSSQQTTTQGPQKVMPTIDTTTATPPTEQKEDELTKPVSNINENTKNIVEEAVQSTYSAEDEDLLLMDDMTPIDNVINAEKTDNNNSDDNNNTDTSNTSTSSSSSSVYDDEDADLLG